MIDKYGGLNVFWDGSKLTTKHHQVVPVPAWFKAQLPVVEFEAELW